MEQKKSNDPKWWHLYSPKNSGRYAYIWWSSIILLVSFTLIRILIPNYSHESYLPLLLAIAAFVVHALFRLLRIHRSIHRIVYYFSVKEKQSGIFSFKWWVVLILSMLFLLMPKIFSWFPFRNLSWFYIVLIVLVFFAYSILQYIKNR